MALGAADQTDKRGGPSGPPLGNLAFLAANVVLAYGISALFAGVFHLSRRLFIVPHVLLTGTLFALLLRYNGIRLRRLPLHNWRWGIVGGAAATAASFSKVFAAPPSAHATGWRLVFDLFWSGVVYATADTLLISILPMLAVVMALRGPSRTAGRAARLGVRGLGVLGSMAVAVAFHAGFPEYGAPAVAGAAFGNLVLTLAYAITASPLAPLIGHWVLHVAAVLHGPATTSLLPPHY